MKILIVSQYFWPESFIISDLVRCLSDEGHVIEVLTGKPNYPDGKIFEGYQAMGISSEVFHQSVPVHRVPLMPRGHGVIRLLLNYVSFVVSGLLFFHRFLHHKQFEVIFVFVGSPVTSAIPALALKKRLKIPLVLWIQDLWPESIQATGFVRSRFVVQMTGRLVRWIYSKTDLLLMQSEAFKTPMAQYADMDKLVYYPNSYLEPTTSSDIPNDLKQTLTNHDCFVFAGNIGTAISIETLIDAAIRLQHLPKCKIILVGSGSMLGWVHEQIEKHHLTQVMCVGRFPMSAMPAILSHAAGLLVMLKRHDVLSTTIPSKIQAYLSVGRPIIGALDGEGARVIQHAEVGFTSPAEDGTAFASNIERVAKLGASERLRLGQRGRAYFLKHFEMREQTRRLVHLLEGLG